MVLERSEKVENIIQRISNKTNALSNKLDKQRRDVQILRIIMQHVGRRNLLTREERKHKKLMRDIDNNTKLLKEYTNVLKSFFKNSNKYTDQEINGLYRNTFNRIVNYVQTFSP